MDMIVPQCPGQNAGTGFQNQGPYSLTKFGALFVFILMKPISNAGMVSPGLLGNGLRRPEGFARGCSSRDTQKDEYGNHEHFKTFHLKAFPLPHFFGNPEFSEGVFPPFRLTFFSRY